VCAFFKQSSQKHFSSTVAITVYYKDIELRMMDFPGEHKQFQCLLSATATQTGTLGEMLN